MVGEWGGGTERSPSPLSAMMGDSVERAPQSYNPLHWGHGCGEGSGVFTHRALPVTDGRLLPGGAHSSLHSISSLPRTGWAGCRPEKLHGGHLEFTEERPEMVKWRGRQSPGSVCSMVCAWKVTGLSSLAGRSRGFQACGAPFSPHL